MRRWTIAVGGLVALLCSPLVAHHSYATYYLENDTIEIEGEIIEFQYRNPHSWIQLQGQENAFENPKIYAVEWAGTSRLESENITRTTLRAGDIVRVWVSPNRNPSDNRVRLKRIERRADGWKWGPGNRRPAR